MALFKPYKIQKTQLETLPKKDGQLIFTVDTGEMYLDISDSERILVENSTNINYNELKNLPQINGIEIKEKLTLSDLGIKQVYTATDIHFEDGQSFQEKYNNGELKGNPGADGKNTVYVGKEEPIDPDMLVWINPDGSGSAGGITDYNTLNNKPQINNKELRGNLSLDDLGIKQTYSAEDIHFSDGQSFQQKYNSGELKGEPGKDGANGTPGKDGANGSNGAPGKEGEPGKSAYQSWLDLGHKGTEQEFIASLKGEPGKDGANGSNGEPGKDGANGTPGKDGSNGDPGKSAYQSWLDTGHEGTEQDFIVSLKGEPGKDGSNGTPGKDGKTPVAGVDYYTQEEKNQFKNEIINEIGAIQVYRTGKGIPSNSLGQDGDLYLDTNQS